MLGELEATQVPSAESPSPTQLPCRTLTWQPGRSCRLHWKTNGSSQTVPSGAGQSEWSTLPPMPGTKFGPGGSQASPSFGEPATHTAVTSSGHSPSTAS